MADTGTLLSLLDQIERSIADIRSALTGSAVSNIPKSQSVTVLGVKYEGLFCPVTGNYLPIPTPTSDLYKGFPGYCQAIVESVAGKDAADKFGREQLGPIIFNNYADDMFKTLGKSFDDRSAWPLVADWIFNQDKYDQFYSKGKYDPYYIALNERDKQQAADWLSKPAKKPEDQPQQGPSETPL